MKSDVTSFSQRETKMAKCGEIYLTILNWCKYYFTNIYLKYFNNVTQTLIKVVSACLNSLEKVCSVINNVFNSKSF